MLWLWMLRLFHVISSFSHGLSFVGMWCSSNGAEQALEASVRVLLVVARLGISETMRRQQED